MDPNPRVGDRVCLPKRGFFAFVGPRLGAEHLAARMVGLAGPAGPAGRGLPRGVTRGRCEDMAREAARLEAAVAWKQKSHTIWQTIWNCDEEWV